MFVHCMECLKLVWFEEEPKHPVCNDCKDNDQTYLADNPKLQKLLAETKPF